MTSLLWFLLSCLMFENCRAALFFRRDYTYVEEFDAFYKLHPATSSWREAIVACESEGSQLFYPNKNNEWTVAQKMFCDGSWSGDTEIFVGIHDQYNLDEFITVDRKPTPSSIFLDGFDSFPRCVAMMVESGKLVYRQCSSASDDNDEVLNVEFICRKTYKMLCPTIDQGYFPSASGIQKCYKINEIAKNWRDAMNTCMMQGGSLLTLDRDEEASFINQILSPNTNYFIGFRKLSTLNGFYDVKGQNIEDGKYTSYNKNEMNQDCGILQKDNNDYTITTEECNNILPYVCQIDTN